MNASATKQLSLLTIFIASSTLLLSCRTAVPTPSLTAPQSTEKNTYKMHSNAPQRASDANTVHFVDLNQDGNLDILVGGNKKVNGFHIEWGDGTGNWSLQRGPTTAMIPNSFAVSDVNRNNKLDVLIGGQGDQKGLQIWSIDPQTQDWALHSSPAESGLFSAVAFADVNHDNWPDIVAARYDNNRDGGILVYLNNGEGGWLSGTGPTAHGIFTDVNVVDIDEDGNLDIIASRRGGLGVIKAEDRSLKQTGGVHIWYGDGNGRWKGSVLTASSDVESLTIADINGDSKLDIFVGLYQQGIGMWLNQDEEWEYDSVYSTGTWSDVRIGDLDGDGHRELVAASNTGQGLHVWSWRNGQFYSDDNLLPSSGTYLDIDLGDIHNNGTLAIAAANTDTGVEIWSGQKAASLPPQKKVGKRVGAPLSVYFDSGAANLNADALATLNQWKKTFLGNSFEFIKLEIQGRADKRPIHTELFPNNIALSKARAESVAAWLTEHGAKKGNIKINALGDTSPLAEGNDPISLKKNRRVLVQSYQLYETRLPQAMNGLNKRDLYNISENHVFKTINGIAEYKVGVGDELSITFWQGGKSEIKKVIVQGDGTVSLPYQAALKVANQTPSEIDAAITNILRKYERNPRIDVFLLKARSKFASVFGEVQSLTRQPTGPGTYALKGKESLVDFLSRIGGPTRQANLNSVQIIRDGKTINLNLNRAIRQGDLTENAIIDDEDTIFIPSLAQSKQQVYVLGEVAKSGIVEFTGDINFLDAISKAGGLTPDAYLPDIRVLRANREQPEILSVNFQRFLEKGDLTQNLALLNKDIIIIPARPVANWNKFIADISPSISLLLQPVSIAQQILTLRVIAGQIQ